MAASGNGSTPAMTKQLYVYYYGYDSFWKLRIVGNRVYDQTFISIFFERLFFSSRSGKKLSMPLVLSRSFSYIAMLVGKILITKLFYSLRNRIRFFLSFFLLVENFQNHVSVR